MNTYVIQQARYAIRHSRAYQKITYEDAKEWLETNKNWNVGVWAGSPEGELSSAYHSEKKMVCNFIVWIYEAPIEEQEEMITILREGHERWTA